MNEKEFKELGAKLSRLIAKNTSIKDGEWITKVLFASVLTFISLRINEGEDKSELFLEFMDAQSKVIDWFLNSGDSETNEKMLTILQDVADSLMGAVIKH